MSQLQGFPFIVASLIKSWIDQADEYDDVEYDSEDERYGTFRPWICIAVDDVMDVLMPLYLFHEFHAVWSDILFNCLNTLERLRRDVQDVGSADAGMSLILLIDVLALTFVENMITSMDGLDDEGFGFARRPGSGGSGRIYKFGFPKPERFYSDNDFDVGCPFPWHYASVA